MIPGLIKVGAEAPILLIQPHGGISFYVHGDIVPNKLRFFARVDTYNPNKNIGSDSAYAALSSPSGYGTGSYKATYNDPGAVASVTSLGDISSKETFFTVGLDFTPYKSAQAQTLSLIMLS
jgi:hypothetical protein